MKNYIYFLLFALFMTSCNTVQKLVEQGRYDEAFEYSVKKLAGKKNKKRKYVVALEDAYIKLNERDINEINFLEGQNNDAVLDRIYSIYAKMDRRQNLIRPLIPLRSKDGYTARFLFENYDGRMNEIAVRSADYHYYRAVELINSAENGYKRNARRAVTALNNTKKYFANYKDTDQLKDKAYEIGTERIAVQFAQYFGGYAGEHALNILSRVNLAELNTTWERFYHYDENKIYDNYIVIEIDDILLGTEREYYDSHNFSKEIEDGFDITYETKIEYKEKVEYVKINPKDKDSPLKKVVKKIPIEKKVEVKTPRFITINASVREIFRERSSSLIGMVKVFDNNSNVPIYEHPIRINHNFESSAFDTSGDSRALPSQFCGVGGFIDNFPSDRNIVDHLSNGLKRTSLAIIGDYDFLSDIAAN